MSYANVVDKILPSVVTVFSYGEKAGRGGQGHPGMPDLDRLPPMFREQFEEWFRQQLEEEEQEQEVEQVGAGQGAHLAGGILLPCLPSLARTHAI